MIDRWVIKARAGQLTEGPSGREKSLEAENEKLKAKVGELTMMIDLLKKAADLARRRKSETSSPVTGKNLAVYQGGAK